MDPLTDVRNDKCFPSEGDLSLVYLDGFDYLRKLSTDVAMALNKKKVPSPAYLRFVSTCKRLKVPLNDGKALLGAINAGCLGGVLLGRSRLASPFQPEGSQVVHQGHAFSSGS